MKKINFVIITLLLFGNLFSLPLWETEDSIRAECKKRPESVFLGGISQPGPEWQRWSYIHQLFKTCDFIKGFKFQIPLLPTLVG